MSGPSRPSPSPKPTRAVAVDWERIRWPVATPDRGLPADGQPHTGRQQPAATAPAAAPYPALGAPPDPSNQQRTLPTATAADAQHKRQRGRDAPPSPSSHHFTLIVGGKEPIVRNLTLWQIDMGDGTWAVSCRTCRLSYRGPKAGADLLFDTHLCEPVIPLRKQTR